MEFKEELSQKVVEIEAIIKKYLPQEEGFQKTVLEAMNYSVLAGGKRLRPMLIQETFHMFGGTGKIVEPFMAAMEMIHTYSLVHDDLPAMDNDTFRRGRKTTHAVYGEAMGILAGDALLNYAYEVAAASFRTLQKCEKSTEEGSLISEYQNVAKALYIMASKAGIYGMVGGQVVDVESEKYNIQLTEEKIMFIHAHKTAALIEASLMIGAILAGAPDKQVSVIEKCGYQIGIAFQIQDDILDVIGDTKVLGKTVGSDEKNQKLTYVTVHGIEDSAKAVKELSEEAIKTLQSMPNRNIFLESLVETLITRNK